MMRPARHPWSLGTTLLLISYSKYSISFPPVLPLAAAESSEIGDLLRREPEFSCHEFEDFEPTFDFQPISPRWEKAPEISDDFFDELDTWYGTLNADPEGVACIKGLKPSNRYMGHSNEEFN
ncbi:hypothetical protein KEM48_003289 [Puccinia striiformis f. sp. tritici PST-130]|nr:hypothetical protein KEM48_003289 [Puccinia striiformis f. sp. tritici PST-130]